MIITSPGVITADLKDVLERLWADNARLRAVLSDIERVAGEFSGYPEPADALLAIERMVCAALTTGDRDD